MKIVQTSIAIFLCMGVVPGYATISINGVQPNNTDAHYLQAVRHMKVPFGSQSGATWEAGNNVVGKTPAEVQAIVIAIRALETDVRQIEIYDRMKSTPTEIFTFGTLAHAKNVVKQRLETVKMMENFNTQQNYWYHTPVNPPSTTAGNWESGARTPFFFRQKDGNASSAITQLCASTTKTYGECYGAISACVWWGAQQGMGDTAFNSLYPSRELNMDFRKSNSSTRNTTPATDTDILVPGDWLYFNNYNYNTIMLTPYFKKKGWLDGKKIYVWSGENSLYFGDGKYEGLGVKSKTISEMREELMNAYNDDLANLISEVGKLGGTYGGMEIVPIIPATAPSKITVINIKRATHSP